MLFFLPVKCANVTLPLVTIYIPSPFNISVIHKLSSRSNLFTIGTVNSSWPFPRIFFFSSSSLLYFFFFSFFLLLTSFSFFYLFLFRSHSLLFLFPFFFLSLLSRLCFLPVILSIFKSFSLLVFP